MTNDDPTRLWGDPSPDEIRDACAEIQREWSPEEELRRRGWTLRRWELPAFKTAIGQRSRPTFTPSRSI
jgi:hypothetical protein